MLSLHPDALIAAPLTLSTVAGMKKLTLDVDRLAVESFPTGDGDGQTPAYDLLATRPEACDPFSLPPRCS